MLNMNVNLLKCRNAIKRRSYISVSHALDEPAFKKAVRWLRNRVRSDWTSVSLQREPPTTSDHADSIMSRTSKALTAQKTVHGTRHPNAESIPYLLALKQLFKNYQFFPVISMQSAICLLSSTLCDVYNGTMYYSLPFFSRTIACRGGHFAASSPDHLSWRGAAKLHLELYYALNKVRD